MLAVRGLKVRYGAVEAVRGIDLDVAEGAIVTLLGANGAGKSSTMAALVGWASSQGSIAFEGASINGLRPEDISRRGIALVPEGRRVFAALTVAENLMLGGAAHRKRHDVTGAAEAMLDMFPILRERHAQPAGLLSGGEQQMLAIARAMMSAPRLLLLDEPSLGLAPMVVDRIFELIVELRERGTTILLVEQNAEQALDVADYGYVLVNGAVELSGPARDLAQSEQVRSAYLGL